MNRICNMILEKRKEHGLTQAELGAMLGISGKVVTKWVHDLSQPCEEHLTQLVAPLGLRVEASTKTVGYTFTSKASFLYTVRKEFVRILAMVGYLRYVYATWLGQYQPILPQFSLASQWHFSVLIQ